MCVQDWRSFVETCGDMYEDTVATLMHLKTSIAKSVPPYTIWS